VFEAMPTVRTIEAAERTFVQRVFGWMGGGLLLTGLIAWYVGARVDWVVSLVSSGLIWVLMIAELVLVFAVGRAANRMSATLASSLFLLYSALNGVTLSVIFVAYTQATIASAFLASALTFGAAATYGAVTKKDLSSFGGFMVMGLIGIVIASVVNLFLRSEGLHWLLTYAGVFVFIGLAAWDMQKIKHMHRNGVEGTAGDRALAIGGALALYLDFINLFLLMLRILGRSKE
jgi:FtsH-binding integral membrane protein